jgi:hypothetical protein
MEPQSPKRKVTKQMSYLFLNQEKQNFVVSFESFFFFIAVYDIVVVFAFLFVYLFDIVLFFVGNIPFFLCFFLICRKKSKLFKIKKKRKKKKKKDKNTKKNVLS